MIDNVDSCVILNESNVFNVSAGDPTMYYYSIFQQIFKFVPRYLSEKSVESCLSEFFLL